MTADAGPANAARRVKLRIEGRVQGVFFRESTRREAERLGVTGWVRNLEDGAVEALVEGAPAAVDALVRWCHQGPPIANVSKVEAAEQPARGDLRGFRVER